MAKFTLPAIIFCILVLFAFSVVSHSDDPPSDIAKLRELPNQQLAEAEKAEQNREQPSTKTADSISAELKRLTDDAAANNEKIAALRSDLLKLMQDAKLSSEKAAQSMLDQVNTLRSEKVQLLKDAKETGDEMAQGLRADVSASQAKLVAQIDDMLKANAARSEALAQRVDAMKNDIDGVKKNLDEERQSRSTISPSIAFFAALAAIILGPFLAYQFTSNQLTRVKQEVFAEATQSAGKPEAEPHPELQQQAAQAPALGGEETQPSPSEDLQPRLDRERV